MRIWYVKLLISLRHDIMWLIDTIKLLYQSLMKLQLSGDTKPLAA